MNFSKGFLVRETRATAGDTNHGWGNVLLTRYPTYINSFPDIGIPHTFGYQQLWFNLFR